jgi:hypothetical protein
MPAPGDARDGPEQLSGWHAGAGTSRLARDWRSRARTDRSELTAGQEGDTTTIEGHDAPRSTRRWPRRHAWTMADLSRGNRCPSAPRNPMQSSTTPRSTSTGLPARPESLLGAPGNPPHERQVHCRADCVLLSVSPRMTTWTRLALSPPTSGDPPDQHGDVTTGRSPKPAHASPSTEPRSVTATSPSMQHVASPDTPQPCPRC